MACLVDCGEGAVPLHDGDENGVGDDVLGGAGVVAPVIPRHRRNLKTENMCFLFYFRKRFAQSLLIISYSTLKYQINPLDYRGFEFPGHQSSSKQAKSHFGAIRPVGLVPIICL